MATIEQLEDAVEKIEKAFKFQGLWQKPYIPPPRIDIQETWDEDTQGAARVLNRLFYIRSLPSCARLFGPVRESAIDAFKHDYPSRSERVNYARNQVNLLISDLPLVRGVDTTALSKVSE